jgi:hypothetical protein
VPTPPLSAQDGAGQLRRSLDTGQRQPQGTPTLERFGRHLDTVSRSDGPGLFHRDEVPGLPRTNNELESHFRDTRRRVLRTTSQQGHTQRTLQRPGAWELLPHPPTEAKVREAFSHTPSEDLPQERQRFAAHRQCFRLQSRSLKQTQAPFEHLRQQWSALQATGTG